ncbi:hypothetical protein AB0G32_36890 [Streptomyces sp. NPDC023723]|uniref:hypothetical protein n=1 Tax=Streptomyces sp. NPDC023723 TaxID=3154323 RepID=UPI0033FB6FB0
MTESLTVRCPVCRRAHRYTAPAYPCACGTPVAPALDPDGTVTEVRRRVWEEEWIGVRCGACGGRGQRPRPELGCPCGTVLSLPVRDPFDLVAVVARHLHGLGHRDLHHARRGLTGGVGLAGRGLLAQVDPSGSPATVRDVECLWLTATVRSARGVHFSRTGYAAEVRARADQLGVPLFVLGPGAVPRPANGAAAALGA